MVQISAEVLALSNEAAVLTKNGKISFANRSAAEIIGSDCIGKRVKDVFGPEISEAQCACFAADVPLMGKHRLVRVSHIEGGLAIFFSDAGVAPAFLNDALIFTLRNSLMNLSMALDSGRAHAEESGDSFLRANYRILTKEYFRISRSIGNASVAHSIFKGNLNVDSDIVDLQMLFSEIIRTVKLLYDKVDFSFNASGIPEICADPMLLEMLLMNLISNCLIHGEGTSRISVSLSDAPESVILSVSDDGCGIPPEKLHMVFSRYMYEYGAGELCRGPGLGLTVARGIAERHGGTLLLESRPGQGTSVRVSLSKKQRHSPILYSPKAEYRPGMNSILTGLADCLDEECFSEKYMD